MVRAWVAVASAACVAFGASGVGLAQPAGANAEQARPGADRIRERLSLAEAQHARGESEAALAEARAALALARQVRPQDGRLVAEALRMLGALLMVRHDYPGARELLQEAYALRTGLDGPDDPAALQVLADLSTIRVRTGELAAGAEGLETVVAAEARLLPAGAVQRIEHKIQLGNAYTFMGRAREAEVHLRGAAEEARRLPETHPVRTMAFQALGSELMVQGRLEEAADLFGQAIDLKRKAGGGRPEELADSLASLGYIYLAMERPEAAEPLFLESQALFDQGGVTASGAAALLAAGTAAAQKGDVKLGFERRRRALDLVLAQPNPHPVALTMFKFKLADSYADMGDLATAEAMEAEALEGLLKIRPEGHFQPLNAAITLGWIQALQGRGDEGLARVRPAIERTMLETRRLEIGRAKTTGVQENLEALGKAMHAAWLGQDADFGFYMAQVLIESDAGRAAAADEARLAAGSGRLAEVLRRRQGLYAERLRLDAEYLRTLSGDAAAADGLKRQIEAVEKEAGEAQAILDAEFPEHAALMRPTPIAISAAQARLDKGEALIVPVATDRGLFTFALTRDGLAWDRVDLTRRTLRRMIASVRASAEPPAAGAPRPFDRTAAFQLHQAIFTPKIRALVKGARTYTFAPDPLFSPLPFSALVTRAPTGDDADPRAQRRTAWLIREAAVKVAPSIPAMRADDAASGGHGLRFIGVGAPALSGQAPVQPAARYYRSGGAHAEAVRSLPPLPSARRELETMAEALGQAQARLIVGEAATEAAVKAADLSGADVIAFATHGLVAGELDALSEPALVFTPPREPGPQDDGLLTASEAARLRLSARWIILSACNTAAGEAMASPGYAGLARAFMFAGGQTVLVSHWPVRDDAAARLTVESVRHAARGGAPEEGLRRAVLRLMDDRETPDAASPAVWAPFVLVGR